MAAVAFPAPTRWTVEESRPGCRVLLAFQGEDVHLVAPPGVPLGVDEPVTSCACWRYALWREKDEVGPPAISVDRPDLVSDLQAVEVVELLPVHLHNFVRLEMQRQLCRAATFSKAPKGELLVDRHAQLAGRVSAWACDELASAFPDECWYESRAPQVRIPSTADELLGRLGTKADGF